MKMIKQTTLREYVENDGENGWVFSHHGDGMLHKITGVSKSWDVYNSFQTFCCTPCDYVYLCNDDDERCYTLNYLQARLSVMRETFKKENEDTMKKIRESLTKAG